MVLFASRNQAGEILSRELSKLKHNFIRPIVLGLPRGGIPVAYAIAQSLNCPLDVLVLRKLPIPDNPEAGFGAVTLDKMAIFNEPLLGRLSLSNSEIDAIINRVYKEVQRRNLAYRKGAAFPLLSGRSVILTDDGLASGYTMLAAIEYCRRKGTAEIIAAVPVAHQGAYLLVKEKAEEVIALHISAQAYFAVASFYAEFPEMQDREVISYLEGQIDK